MNQPIFYQPNIIGFAPYDPRKATRLILDHVHEVLEAYSLNLPLTLRQIYYRLIATHEHYPKTDVFYQKLSSIISRARRAGIIPWSAIRDDGIRHEHCGGGFSGLSALDQAITRSAQAYVRNKWQGQPKQIIVICEAGGMVEQIVSAVGDYPAIVRSSGGMDSLTSKYGLAEICKQQDTVILHIGDFDPSGISIFTGIYHDVAQMIIDQCAADGAEPPEFDCRRVTILPEHVNQYGLLTGTMKSADACKDQYPDRTIAPRVAVGSRTFHIWDKAREFAETSDSQDELFLELQSVRDWELVSPETYSDERLWKAAKWVWQKRLDNKLWGRSKSVVQTYRSEFKLLMEHKDGLQGLALLHELCHNHGGKARSRQTFRIAKQAMADADVISGWSKNQYIKAQKALLDSGLIICIKSGNNFVGASEYVFANSNKQGEGVFNYIEAGSQPLGKRVVG